jgi:hypothetical protein
VGCRACPRRIHLPAPSAKSQGSHAGLPPPPGSRRSGESGGGEVFQQAGDPAAPGHRAPPGGGGSRGGSTGIRSRSGDPAPGRALWPSRRTVRTALARAGGTVPRLKPAAPAPPWPSRGRGHQRRGPPDARGQDHRSGPCPAALNRSPCPDQHPAPPGPFHAARPPTPWPLTFGWPKKLASTCPVTAELGFLLGPARVGVCAAGGGLRLGMLGAACQRTVGNPGGPGGISAGRGTPRPRAWR